ncbi:MAG: type 4a pilus biogenesis protein PilO [Polyangiales bacterium]
MQGALLMAGQRSFEDLSLGARVAIPVLGLAIASVLFYVALYMGLSDDLSTAQGQEAQLNAKLAQNRKLSREYEAITAELNQRSARDAQNRRVLPTRTEMASFLQDLNRAAERHGLRIDLVQPQEPEAQALYVRLPVVLKLSGRYSEIVHFFAGVSQLDRVINMQNVELSAQPRRAGDASQGMLAVDVLASTFRSPNDAEIAAQKDDAKGKKGRKKPKAKKAERG